MTQEFYYPSNKVIFRSLFEGETGTEFLSSFLSAVFDAKCMAAKAFTPSYLTEVMGDVMGIVFARCMLDTCTVVDCEILLASEPRGAEAAVSYAGQWSVDTSKPDLVEELREHNLRRALLVIYTYPLGGLLGAVRDYIARGTIEDGEGNSLQDVIELSFAQCANLPLQSDQRALWPWLAFLSASKGPALKSAAQAGGPTTLAALRELENMNRPGPRRDALIKRMQDASNPLGF